jgi:hypothetical protein
MSKENQIGKEKIRENDNYEDFNVFNGLFERNTES